MVSGKGQGGPNSASTRPPPAFLPAVKLIMSQWVLGGHLENPTAGLLHPDLPFLAFLDFLAFFVARNFLAFWSVFPFFPRDFRGSA